MKSLFLAAAAALLLSSFACAEMVSPALREGEAAPPFMLPNLDDNRVSLRDFCGAIRNPWKNTKRYIVIVSFMASYCVPCRQEIPQLEAFAKTAEEDVKVIFISVDTIPKEPMTVFAQKMNITQMLLLDRYGSTMKKYGVQRLPSLFILDKDGILRFQNLNGLPADVDLADLLKKKIASIRSVPAGANPATVGVPADKKNAILKSLLSARSAEEMARDLGLTADEVGKVKSEIEGVVKERWSAE